MYEDLSRKDAVEYWRSEGNNKWMQKYYKLQGILRMIRWIITMIFIIYLLKLVSESMITICTGCLMEKLDSSLWIFNIYKILVILLVFCTLYLKRKNYSIEKIAYIFITSLLIMPLVVLVVFHFAVLGSLMSSFYLVVLFVVTILLISKLINRINILYDAATKVVENNKAKRKGEKYAR